MTSNQDRLFALGGIAEPCKCRVCATCTKPENVKKVVIKKGSTPSETWAVVRGGSQALGKPRYDVSSKEEAFEKVARVHEYLKSPCLCLAEWEFVAHGLCLLEGNCRYKDMSCDSTGAVMSTVTTRVLGDYGS